MNVPCLKEASTSQGQASDSSGAEEHKGSPAASGWGVHLAEHPVQAAAFQVLPGSPAPQMA